MYYAWSRPGEAGAPLDVIENRFPALFESRRMLYPRFEALSDPARFDQGVAGFLDHIMKANFTAFLEQAAALTGQPAVEVERIGDDGRVRLLDASLLDAADTVVVISFDSLRTGQRAWPGEIEAVRAFLDRPDSVLFLCPHHDIGEVDDAGHEERLERQTEAFLHHGDHTIPPQQGFGGFGRSLMAAIGLPVENRFGLRPATGPDGSPRQIEVEDALDRLHLLSGVPTFNLHPHLPHLERIGAARDGMDVLARQFIDLDAPPHPFTSGGRDNFDALLQSRDGLFQGSLLVGDATLWSSTAGGLDSLKRLWRNLLTRPRRS